MAIFIQAIVTFLQLYTFVILARVLLSWIPLDRSNPIIDQIVTLLYDVTEPVLQPVRDLLPQGMGLDFSPIIVFIGIRVLTGILVSAF